MRYQRTSGAFAQAVNDRVRTVAQARLVQHDSQTRLWPVDEQDPQPVDYEYSQLPLYEIGQQQCPWCGWKHVGGREALVYHLANCDSAPSSTMDQLQQTGDDYWFLPDRPAHGVAATPDWYCWHLLCPEGEVMSVCGQIPAGTHVAEECYSAVPAEEVCPKCLMASPERWVRIDQ